MLGLLLPHGVVDSNFISQISQFTTDEHIITKKRVQCGQGLLKRGSVDAGILEKKVASNKWAKVLLRS